jgi:hypothetical protein
MNRQCQENRTKWAKQNLKHLRKKKICALYDESLKHDD